MDTPRICKECRQPLPENAPEGLCPACLAKVALGSEPAAPCATVNISPLAAQAAPASASGAPGPRVAPDVSQLAAQFPQLEILELLGMGGMGMVYKARQPNLDRIVALKILPKESAPHPSFAERFSREAKALAKLNHPGIVNVYDFGQTSEYYYFVMEFVDGMNLRALLNHQPIEPRQALELVTQICTALQFAHDEGVVHRDIKPENILITKKGQVKIADFGLAKLLGNAPDTALTMSQAAMGTMNYMAPEQRQNAQTVDHRADIYSLGVVFYEMLTGEVPMGRFEPPSKRVQVDVRLDEVVLRALEREPARRYQHVSEVRSGVETITSTMPQAPAASPAVPLRAIPQPTFARGIVKPMIGPFLVWVASLLVAWKWPSLLALSIFIGIGVLTGGLPSAFFTWRCKAAGRGLHWRQLPPAVRRRGNWRMVAVAVPCVIALFAGMAGFPSRTVEWREEWFYPKSHSYEKLVLSGNITGWRIPFWRTNSVAGSGTMAIKIYRNDSTPAMLTFTLPGLNIENDSHDPGQPSRMLTIGSLTNWLHDSARLDLAQPQVQEEARQLMNFFEPYYEKSPPAWQRLTEKAQANLPGFDFGGMTSHLAEMGAFGWLFYALMAFPGICLCVYYCLALPIYKSTFAEGRAEIEAGRWTPPQDVKALPLAAPSASPVSPNPRMSKTAIVGAAWAFGFFLFALVSFLVVGLSHMADGTRPETPSDVVRLLVFRWSTATASYTPWWQSALMITIISVGLTAPFGVTILGCMSLSQIRHSARLYGRSLALFDALLFPMLLANGLVFVLLMGVYFWNGHSPAGASDPHSVSQMSPIPVFAITGLIVAGLNFFVVRKIWRIYRR